MTQPDERRCMACREVWPESCFAAAGNAYCRLSGPVLCSACFHERHGRTRITSCTRCSRKMYARAAEPVCRVCRGRAVLPIRCAECGVPATQEVITATTELCMGCTRRGKRAA